MSVLVHSHGGGHTAGHNGLYFGKNVMTHTEDVVVVNIQYRLGVFGSAGTQELHDSPDYVTSPLLYDHEAALQWIHANIHHFGGDASKITFSGFSAGAINVGMLLSSTRVCPLIHRGFAIGYWNTAPRVTRTVSLSQQENIIKTKFGVTNATNFLLTAPAHQLRDVTPDLADSTGDTRPLQI